MSRRVSSYPRMPEGPEDDQFWWDPKRYVRTDLGTIMAQPVGNTSYGKGLHIYIRLAGEEERVKGSLSFGATIEPDGSITWGRRQRGYCELRDTDRAEEIEAAALEVARAWFERDPIHCAMYYADVAEEELYTLKWKLRDEQRTIDHLSKLLADPAEPRTHNVKNEEGEWERIPHTEEERVEYRQLWARRVKRAEDKLVRLHEEHDARIAQLKAIRAKCDAFLRDDTLPLLPFAAVADHARTPPSEHRSAP